MLRCTSLICKLAWKVVLKVPQFSFFILFNCFKKQKLWFAVWSFDVSFSIITNRSNSSPAIGQNFSYFFFICTTFMTFLINMFLILSTAFKKILNSKIRKILFCFSGDTLYDSYVIVDYNTIKQKVHMEKYVRNLL